MLADFIANAVDDRMLSSLYKQLLTSVLAQERSTVFNAF